MRFKVDEKTFINALVETNSPKLAAEKLGLGYGGVIDRTNRYMQKGLIDIVNGKYVAVDPDEVKTKRHDSEDVVDSYRPERDPAEELGNSKNSGKIMIDTSEASEGQRFLKHTDTLDRIDIIMSQMKETDSLEVKGLFRNLVCKIFESSLK